MLLRNIKNRVDVESMITEIAFFNLKCYLSMFLQFYLLDDMKIANRIPKEKNKIADLSIMKIKRSWVDWNFQFFHIELTYSLIAYKPRIKKKLSTFILPI